MWAWIATYLASVYGAGPLIGDSLDLASLIAFLVFVAGAAGSIVAGFLAERYGRTAVTSWAMAISGGMALFIGFLPEGWTIFIVIVALVWGASVVADSAQFSTALTELSEEAYRGTALTFQTGLGFLLTIVTIKLVPLIADSAGWGLAFALLGVGPMVGIYAMVRLRTLPESTALAMGRR